MNRLEAYAIYAEILKELRHISDETFSHICLMEHATTLANSPVHYYIYDSRHECVTMPHFVIVIDCVGWHECRTP